MVGCMESHKPRISTQDGPRSLRLFLSGGGQGSAAVGSQPAPGSGKITVSQGPSLHLPSTSTSSSNVARQAVLSLISRSSRRWSVDRHHRLHLPVRCAAHRPACAVTVSVNRVRRSGVRLLAGSRVGSRSLTVGPGRTRTILIALHGVHAGLLWISVHGRDKHLMLQTVISVSWP
jgi:hypothetical protein